MNINKCGQMSDKSPALKNIHTAFLVRNHEVLPTLLSLTGVAPKSRGKDVSTGSLGHLRRQKDLRDYTWWCNDGIQDTQWHEKKVACCVKDQPARQFVFVALPSRAELSSQFAVCSPRRGEKVWEEGTLPLRTTWRDITGKKWMNEQ